MKIRIKRANTENACIAFDAFWTDSLSNRWLRMQGSDYIDELRQQAKWNSEKCQRAQCATGE